MEHPLGFTEVQVQALWESAEHWLYNLSNPRFARVSPADCACCLIWHPEFPVDPRASPCQGCPVAEITSEMFCRGTPYGAARQALRYSYKNPEAFVRRATAEYRFLVCLALGDNPYGEECEPLLHHEVQRHDSSIP